MELFNPFHAQAILADWNNFAGTRTHTQREYSLSLLFLNNSSMWLLTRKWMIFDVPNSDCVAVAANGLCVCMFIKSSQLHQYTCILVFVWVSVCYAHADSYHIWDVLPYDITSCRCYFISKKCAAASSLQRLCSMFGFDVVVLSMAVVLVAIPFLLARCT